MDSALVLKQKFSKGQISSFSDARPFLDQSQVVSEILQDFDIDVLSLMNRLIELAEIPFTDQLSKVQHWLSKLVELSFFEGGYSYTGKEDDLLSCYNSMITSVLIRLNYADESKIQNGIEWILKYQNVERDLENKWPGKAVLKYGGCLQNTPCYIGVVKAMIALTDYKSRKNYKKNLQLENKLHEGLEYILGHELFLRRSCEKPITAYINKLTYPYSYKTNVIELLKLMKENNRLGDQRCDNVVQFLQSRKQKAGYWKINKLYQPKSWVLFDKPKQPGDWITHEINSILESRKD